MAELFGRVVELEIGVPGQEGVRIARLRVSFDATQTISGPPNKARIQVFNPGDDVLGLLEQEGVLVRVLAGYRTPQVVFQGDPDTDGVGLAWSGPDQVLTISATDGGRELDTAFVDITRAGKTTPADLIRLARRELGVGEGPIASIDTPIEWPTFTFFGSASELLDDVSEALDADWSIRDGLLAIVPRDGDTGEEAPLYTYETSLVGDPRRISGGEVEVTVLLDNSMRPGRPFVVRSDRVSGTYVATTVRHTGDTGYTGIFHTIIRGRER